ncbi:MAG: hypothetical protein EPO01_03415 [Aquabacterium sp.]|nr:MAG: hypothetical protein EPO01_03415 [Aquabacterium sp.]
MNHLSDAIVWVIVAAAAVYAARALLPANVGRALRLRPAGDDGGCHGPSAAQRKDAACGAGCSGCATGQAARKA